MEDLAAILSTVAVGNLDQIIQVFDEAPFLGGRSSLIVGHRHYW